MSKSITRERLSDPPIIRYAKRMREEGFFNDVTLSAEGEFLPANKLILSCCSEFFEKMFKSNMKEQYEKSVSIEAVDSKSLKLLINYIYEGKIMIDSSCVFDLMACADYLQIDEVKQFCFDYLEAEIDSDNCLAILNAATMYMNDSLKKHVYNYIRKHYAEIALTLDFKLLSKDQVKACISNLNRNQVKETVVCKSIVDWTKYDEEGRKKDFLELWQMMKLSKLPYDYLESLICEKLICENLICSNLMNMRLLQLLKDRRMLESETKIVSVGGWGTKVKVVEVYNPTGKSLTNYANFPVPIEAHTLLKHDNYIYCLGGYCIHVGLTDKAWRGKMVGSDIQWEEIASLSEKRQTTGVALFNDRLVLVGGRNIFGRSMVSSEYYIFETNEWSTFTPLTTPLQGNQLVYCDGCLYSIGGVVNDEKRVGITERLGELDGSWETVAPLNTPRDIFCAVNCLGEIYAIGGMTDNKKVLKTVEKYDFEANEWIFVKSLNVERCRFSACVFHGKIFAIGGIKDRDKAVKEIECYDPSLNTWEIVGKTTDELFNHAVVVL